MCCAVYYGFTFSATTSKSQPVTKTFTPDDSGKE